MLDVLIYVFEKHLRSHGGVCFHRERLAHDLINAGFDDEQVSDALVWLDELKQGQADMTSLAEASAASIRGYHEEEIAKLGASNINLLISMEKLRILSVALRELVMDRLMALPGDRLATYQVKCVVLLVLLSDPDGARALATMEYFMMKDVAEVRVH